MIIVIHIDTIFRFDFIISISVDAFVVVGWLGVEKGRGGVTVPDAIRVMESEYKRGVKPKSSLR